MPGKRTIALAVACLALAVPVAAQVDGDAPGAKRALAHRIDTPLRLDGRLDEPAWRWATVISDFRQKEPVENGEPSERTDVAFLYDDHALYVGARMYHRDPGAIARGLTRRDQYGNAEHIVISLDPHLDRRTAYSFSVTASGVRRDYYHPRDTDEFGARDFTFDPVWEARAAVDSAGWTAEMRIPFSQLRFAAKPVHEWGLNILRWIPGRNEDIFWVVVPRTQTGFVSRFGTLSGIEGIPRSRRLELLPYTAGNAVFRGAATPANRLDPNGRSLGGRAGADLKMGLSAGLTLDATVNPDFGQVEADPAEVNLSAFETFFDERRPFFTEGRQLLGSTVSSYFYSRRIGAPPRGPVDADFVDRPDFTTILGAAKVTGRLPSGLSIGGLTAVTGREHARTYDSTGSRFGRTAVEPAAAYGVIRLQQQFGVNGSTVGVIASGVRRDLGDEPVMRAVMPARAVAGGADWVFRFDGGRYELAGDVGASHVAGSREAMLLVQQAPQRYLQRPDYRHTALDPTRTHLEGWRARLRGDKNAGNWLWGAELEVESPLFETNDMGRLQGADDIDFNADINHRWTTPGSVFRAATLGVFVRSNWNLDGVRTRSAVSVFSRHTWRNFMTSSLTVSAGPRGLSDDLTRGGPLMVMGGGVEVNAGLSSSFATPTQWSLGLNWFDGELGQGQTQLRGSVTLRPSPSLNVSLEPRYIRARDPYQYIATISGGPAATFGQRYVFGAIDRSTLSARLRLNYTVSPALTLEAYAEPFAASGRYRRIGELAAPKTRLLRVYGTDGTTILSDTGPALEVRDDVSGDTFLVPRPDFEALSFRSNLVVRWEWQPGSTIFLVWQQNRQSRCTLADPDACPDGRAPGGLVGPGTLRHTWAATGDQYLAVKATYWISVR